MSKPTLEEIKAFFKDFDYKDAGAFEVCKGQVCVNAKRCIDSHIRRLDYIKDSDQNTKQKNIQYWKRLVSAYRYFKYGEII